MAFANVEPFGDERADLRAAVIASSAANLWGAKTKYLDFMPIIRKLQNWDRMSKGPQSAADIEAFFVKLASGSKKGKKEKLKDKKRRK